MHADFSMSYSLKVWHNFSIEFWWVPFQRISWDSCRGHRSTNISVKIFGGPFILTQPGRVLFCSVLILLLILRYQLQLLTSLTYFFLWPSRPWSIQKKAITSSFWKFSLGFNFLTVTLAALTNDIFIGFFANNNKFRRLSKVLGTCFSGLQSLGRANKRPNSIYFVNSHKNL